MNELPIYISLGAGVQSSTMALMASRGELPGSERVQGCIFADTQDEPPSVYTWLDWLEKQLPWPLHKITSGKISADSLLTKTGKAGQLYQKTTLPVYTLDESGFSSKINHRSCTVSYKIRPIMKKLRQLMKVKRGQSSPVVIQWIGISLDEMQRMKPSREPWAKCEWPLVASRMTRRHCLEWMEKNNYPKPPRSSCVFCPFHRDAEWRRLQTEEPEEFAKAIEFEKKLQKVKLESSELRSTPFLHKSCKPLETIDFRSDVERGQNLLFDDNWNDECEGMCGV